MKGFLNLMGPYGLTLFFLVKASHPNEIYFEVFETGTMGSLMSSGKMSEEL